MRMKLEDTIGLMCAEDYRDRLKAEYLQLVIRLRNLSAYWDRIEDRFSPQGSYIFEQLIAMKTYRSVLRKRMYHEGLLPDSLDAVCDLDKKEE